MKISPNELCETLGISRRTLNNWQHRRVVPFYRIGRRVLFDLAEVDEALKRYRCIAIGEPRRRMGRLQY
ncbi:MAG TPA: excisionase family DNA-binding protein [Verrucomicrobiae bacterium]|nr:excisionase family DNA-binding protein [Verrucomicrobiae bacterium]